MTPEPDIQPEIRTVTVRHAYNAKDVDLCYAHWAPEVPNNETVVAVHGLTRQKRDFDYIARFLAAQGYEVYAVDAPGRGGSAWLAQPDDYNLFNFADIFAAFLKQINLARVHWLGTSMGGLLAMVMALKDDGDKFRTMLFNDITHKPNRAALHRIAGYMTETLPLFDSPEQYETMLRQNLPLGDVPEDVWGHYAQHQLKKIGGAYTFHFDPKLVRRAAADLKAAIDLGESIKRIPCPMALVAGSVSDLCTPAEIGDLKKLRPDLYVHVVPGAGHVPALSDTASQQFILEHLQRG